MFYPSAKSSNMTSVVPDYASRSRAVCCANYVTHLLRFRRVIIVGISFSELERTPSSVRLFCWQPLSKHILLSAAYVSQKTVLFILTVRLTDSIPLPQRLIFLTISSRTLTRYYLKNLPHWPHFKFSNLSCILIRYRIMHLIIFPYLTPKNSIKSVP